MRCARRSAGSKASIATSGRRRGASSAIATWQDRTTTRRGSITRSPGTGQSPVKAAPGGERTISKAIDAVLARGAVDPKRVALYGGSFGGTWATILAVTEKARLRAVVVQSPPIHETFSRARTLGLANNREYLFDYVPAQLFTYGASSMDELVALRERMSLKARGLLEQPMAPMLV